MAGIPATNLSLYRAIRFKVGDPAALICLTDRSGATERVLIIRDIEMERAKRHARADRVHCPADFEPKGWSSGGLSGDRETATAQSVAQCLVSHGVTSARADRSLPFIFAHFMRMAGIELVCDTEMGVLERRAKDAQELDWLREAQRATEGAMKLAKRISNRSQIIAFNNAYHGSTQGALSIMGGEYWRNAYRPLLPDILHVDFNTQEAIDTISEKTACVVVEVVQAEAGAQPANVKWLQALRD
ncbi:MAG: hypothetical protein RL354_1873, partial [Planctomycetota bacterium]